MPPLPKASPSQGPVRTRSGCYTCRVRRKKCDERRVGDEVGSCQTCVRLGLECLGFGRKRPDWLKDDANVTFIRALIKDHLNAQGLIKGQHK
ncbi:hypothetical protein CPB83DRAFT_784424 [Crepidotus variabilis]|uniref:Zn(2)-C6 fungal-type domain-containing protein n=1 Tax=Crepidotus variabilis TaxID=179855 RepID=A0A9P6JU42_9AGAR|nr:hypothetical protein CPB83DRAFT_784424 [Crepidotus variabilis]